MPSAPQLEIAQPAARPPRLPAAGVAGVILAIAATLVAPAMAAAPAADATRVVAIFPLWWSSARTVGAAASAGRIVSAGGAPFAVEVAGDAPALSRRLHDAGALILLPPAAAALCGGSAPETSR